MTRKELRPLTSGDPDEIDLELVRLGAVADRAVEEKIRKAEAGPLASAADEMDRYTAFFQEHAPGLPSGPSRQRRRPAWARPLLLAALVLLAVTVVLWSKPESSGIRAMGTLPVDVTVVRSSEALPEPAVLAPGDELHLAFVAPVDGYAEVWSMQEDGAVSALVVAAPVQAGQRFELPGAVRLDAYQGREWLVVGIRPEPRTEAEIVRGAAAELPELSDRRHRRRWALEITRGR